MINKIEERIIEILKKDSGLDAYAIKEELEITYDTTSKHLKKMVEGGILERKAEGKPWAYYYKLKII